MNKRIRHEPTVDSIKELRTYKTWDDLPDNGTLSYNANDDNSNNLAEPDSSLSSEDDSSVASNKDFYKNLCQRLTASLVDKKEIKRENKQVKQENKRLRRENSELNAKLRDIGNMCAGRNGNNE